MENKQKPGFRIPVIMRDKKPATQVEVLQKFVSHEKALEGKRDTSSRLAGHPYDIIDSQVRMATCDAYRDTVGQIRAGDLLMMIRNDMERPTSFLLLRVLGDALTPLSSQAQQAAYEIGRKYSTGVDLWTAAELQWHGVECHILGTVYADKAGNMVYAGDIDGHLTPYRYTVYAPSREMLDIIINGDGLGSQLTIGQYRATECPSEDAEQHGLPVRIDLADFAGKRTAIFAVTRNGKTTLVRTLAGAMMGKVAQLIFDAQGEYANGTTGFDGVSLAQMYPKDTAVFAITPKPGVHSEMMKLNLYELPELALPVLRYILGGIFITRSHYAEGFLSVIVPSIAEVQSMPPGGEKLRGARKILLLWAILNRAGFPVDETKLAAFGLGDGAAGLNPGFSHRLRSLVYGASMPPTPHNLDSLAGEFRAIYNLYRADPAHEVLESKSGRPIIDSDMAAMLAFLFPASGSGPAMLRPAHAYHSAAAGDAVGSILRALEEKKTVIIDLANAAQPLVVFYSEMVSRAIFDHRTALNVAQALKPDDYVQLFYEEAHLMFPQKDDKVTDIYSTIAKMAGKLGLGLTYSTQSPSTISRELIRQTENFFLGNLPEQEVECVSAIRNAYRGMEQVISRTRSPGYFRMLTASGRIVVPVQVAAPGKDG